MVGNGQNALKMVYFQCCRSWTHFMRLNDVLWWWPFEMTVVVNVWCRQKSSLLLLRMFKGPVSRLLNFMPLRSHVFGSFLPYIRSVLTFLDQNLTQNPNLMFSGSYLVLFFRNFKNWEKILPGRDFLNSHWAPSEDRIELSFTNQIEKGYEITQ